MSNLIRLVEVNDDVTRAAAKGLIQEYLEWFNKIAHENYGLTFDIGGMAASDIEDTQKFYPPSGRFYLVVHEIDFVGVGCLKRLDDETAEVQRMYVRPSARGLGAGRLIIDQLINEAKKIGYKRLRLESLKVLTSAHSLYRSTGFKAIRSYTGHSMQAYEKSKGVEVCDDNTLFMELEI